MQWNRANKDGYRETECDILCNTKKHEPYLEIDYEELENVNFVQWDEADNAEQNL